MKFSELSNDARNCLAIHLLDEIAKQFASGLSKFLTSDRQLEGKHSMDFHFVFELDRVPVDKSKLN